MIDYLYLFLYRSFELLVNILPKPAIDRTLDVLSTFAYRFSKKHQKIINTNLDLAFDNMLNKQVKDKIGIHTFYNLLQVIIGIIKRDKVSKEELLNDLTFVNEDILLNALKKNKKIIFITGHYGNWELIPPALTTKFNIALSIIGRKLDSPVMDKILVSKREKFNVKMIYRQGAIKHAINALKHDSAVGLLLDQHLGMQKGGIEVNFFNHKVYQSPAASVLGRLTDAAIIPLFISTNDYKKYTLTFYPALPIIKTAQKEDDIKQMTQAQSDIIEKVIRNKPNEWFWVHKRWKGFYPELYKKD